MPVTDAWSRYEPGHGRPWNLALAAHLLRRTGFGGNWSQLQQALADGPQRTLDRLLAPPPDLDAFERGLAPLEAGLDIHESGADECAQMWLYRMRHTPYPWLEKMTLFWHNHFAIASARAGRGGLMARHLALLRHGALGRFDTLLRGVARDPATLLALGARHNPKARPPETFAAALLDLYTLGPAASKPDEVREVARAFTGWGVLRDEFHYGAQDHDPGAKSGDEILKSLLARPATPRHVVRKLYAWLIAETETPGDGLIAPLAEAFAQDYDIGKLAGTMLRSRHFFSEAAYRQRVKSPVEYALSIAIALDRPVAPASLHVQLARLGQRLLDPPTREGWTGGRAWLNRFTIVGRGNLAAALLAGAAPQPDHPAELLLQNDPPAAAGQAWTAHRLVMLPEFQLA